MSKFILTGDMPKSCSECELAITEWAEVEVNGVSTRTFVYRCILGKGTVMPNTLNPDCPLQDTTELLKDCSRLSECIRNSDDERALERIRKSLGGKNE